MLLHLLGVGTTGAIVVGASVGAIVGDEEGATDGCSDVAILGLADGASVVTLVTVIVGLSVGSETEIVGSNVGEAIGETVGEFVGTGTGGGVAAGGSVPTAFSMAWPTEIQTVIRLSSINGEFSGSKSIAASAPTQQFGVWKMIEQKQAPYTKFVTSEKGRSVKLSTKIAPLLSLAMNRKYSSSDKARSLLMSLSYMLSTQS